MTGFALAAGRARAATASPLAAIARARRARRSTSTAPRSSTTRYRALDARLRRPCPHRLHYAIKANATLGVVAPPARRSAPAPTPTPAARSKSRCARASRPATSSSPASARRATSSSAPIALGVARHQRGVARRGRRASPTSPRAHGRRARVAVRINPDVDAGSHPHISTGLARHQVRHVARRWRARWSRDVARRPQPAGRRPARARRVADHAARAAGARGRGASPTWRATLAAEGIALEHLDLGGGLGIAYEPGQTVVSRRGLCARAVLPAVGAPGSTLVLEPGRWIVGPAGVLLTPVVDLKAQPGGGWFVIVDAGMTDLMRPALYGAWHGIEPVAAARRRRDPRRRRRTGLRNAATRSAAIATLPPVEVGDLARRSATPARTGR